MGTEKAREGITNADLQAIEISSAVMAAGLRELALFDSRDRGEWIVAAIYRAMVVTANRERVRCTLPGGLHLEASQTR